jgi:hypothetical protein
MKSVKIQDNEDLIRDVGSNAILNSNMSSLEKYKARRNKEREMNDDVQTLKNDMKEIKELLQQLIK